MIVMFMVGANTGLAAVSALCSATVYAIDQCARLRLDRLRWRRGPGTWSHWLARCIAEVHFPLLRFTDALVSAVHMCSHVLSNHPAFLQY